MSRNSPDQRKMQIGLQMLTQSDSDTSVRGCLAEMAGVDDNSSSPPPPPPPISVHPIDSHVGIHSVAEHLDDPDNQTLRTHARSLRVNGAILSDEQPAAPSALLVQRASPYCVLFLVGLVERKGLVVPLMTSCAIWRTNDPHFPTRMR